MAFIRQICPSYSLIKIRNLPHILANMSYPQAVTLVHLHKTPEPLYMTVTSNTVSDQLIIYGWHVYTQVDYFPFLVNDEYSLLWVQFLLHFFPLLFVALTTALPLHLPHFHLTNSTSTLYIASLLLIMTVKKLKFCFHFKIFVVNSSTISQKCLFKKLSLKG